MIELKIMHNLKVKCFLVFCVVVFVIFVIHLNQSDDFQPLNFWCTQREHKSYNACTTKLEKCLQYINETRNISPKLISFKRGYEKENTNYLVPDIVHLIRFKEKFQFLHYINLKGIDRFIKPKAVFLWADVIPTDNEWWKMTVKEIPNIYFIPTKQQTEIAGKKVKYVAHSTDILRLQLLKDYGGIYLDNDVIVLNSFHSLMNYTLVMDRESEAIIANGVMVARPNSEFIRIWLESYNTYNPNIFEYNSVRTAHRLYVIFPHLVHLAQNKFVHPAFDHEKELYQSSSYNLKGHFTVHLYRKYLFYLPRNFDELDRYACTAGNAMRKAVYGNEKLRRTDNTEVGYNVYERAYEEAQQAEREKQTRFIEQYIHWSAD